LVLNHFCTAHGSAGVRVHTYPEDTACHAVKYGEQQIILDKFIWQKTNQCNKNNVYRYPGAYAPNTRKPFCDICKKKKENKNGGINNHVKKRDYTVTTLRDFCFFNQFCNQKGSYE